jgi:hypothetical protein
MSKGLVLFIAAAAAFQKLVGLKSNNGSTP